MVPFALVTSVASAEEGAGGYPVSFVERPLTLPKMVLNPSLEFEVAHIEETSVAMGLGARLGVVDDFEINAVVLPFTFAPKFKYGSGEFPGDFAPRLGATYRFHKGDVEVGGSLELHIKTSAGRGDTSGVVLEPGLPVHVHLGKSARLDTGAFLPIAFLNQGQSSLGLSIPARLAYDVIEPLHVGVNTGFGISDLTTHGPRDSVGQHVYIPLGIFGGYAIAGKKGPLLDIDPFLQWPTFATPGSAAGYNKINADKIQVGLEIGGFLYL